uniref:LAGLIDADG homing endonuclease n=1 Tax=Panagrolaimus sp. ES5 TaxID=591445 RepID=A0AC34G4U7_9BILA
MGSDSLIEKVHPELIAFDNRGNICYKGYCNIKYADNKLRVKPSIKEVAPINILFVFAGNQETQDFALVYRDKEVCKMIYDELVPEEVKLVDSKKKNKKKPVMKSVTEGLNRRFLGPICQEVRKKSDPKISTILKEWLDGFSEKTREDPMNYVKEQDAYDVLYSDDTK